MGESWLPRNRAAAVAAAQRLRVEAATADVVQAFEAHGVRSILLKGAAIARWLYTEGSPRTFSDCDLLVPPADRPAAEDVLRALGFEPHVDERMMPDWWTEHAVGWLRRQDGGAVDLHRTLPGVGVEPQRVWDTMAANTDEIVVGGVCMNTLTTPGLAFHLALHAAQHGGLWGIKLEELERGLATADNAVWQRAAGIAAELEATEAFAAGLRLVPAGRALAEQLDLPADTTTEVALWAGRAPAVAAGFDQLARAPDLRTRLAILGRKIVPPPTFMRAWSPRARAGRRELALAYLWRPLWLALRAPSGYRAWRAARRRASR